MSDLDIVPPDLLEDVNYITSVWRQGIEAIIETGRRLIEVRAKHIDEPGKWSRLIGAHQWTGQSLLPFQKSQTYNLIAIAEDPWLFQHVGTLPSDIYTLTKLTQLTNERRQILLDEGRIHPSMKRTEASAITREERRSQDEARVKELAPIEGKFNTLVLDPPWFYDMYSPATRGRPEYAEMSLDELAEMDVSQWARDDCHIYVWATNNYVLEAGKLMDAWGFQYKTLLTWVKPRWGLGAYFRHQTEQCLFGLRGKMPTRADNISTIIEGPQREHSEKPDEFYDIVRRASHPPYGEVFQRTGREDFTNVFT